MLIKIIKKIKSLPTSPGVYIFKNKMGIILYVGKATSLKDRVGSYFNLTPTLSLVRRGGWERPIEISIDQVDDIEIKKTETVLEAYILEQELIKKWQPKFNVEGKDDRSFSYVIVTKEDFPKFVILRKTDLKNVGTDLVSVRKRHGQIQEGQIRNNNGQLQNQRGQVEIGKGQTQGLSLQEKQFSKIYGPYISKKNIEIVLKILRKIFPYHQGKQKTEKGCLDFQIGLCPGPYAGAISKEDYAKNIRSIQMILAGKKKTLLNKLKKEMIVHSEKQEFEKAGKIRNEIFALQHIQDVALISKNRDALKCVSTDMTMRIEGYDISNISGKSSVGSMVVFDNTNNVETHFNASGQPNKTSVQPNKSQYRKFKIKTVEGANDIASMQEVLSRRFSNNWPMPNLIIIDGGQGHLTAVRQVLKNFHLEIPLLAVAKGSTRKKLDRYIFGSVPEISDEIVEQVRDEAHRFAIAYHKKLRKKNFME
ncbi:MAG: UvrB/UvrC motif-containing protein [Candidatus Moraniibacteriota bacterium]